jgi:rhodanese-related sulfurtransferase
MNSKFRYLVFSQMFHLLLGVLAATLAAGASAQTQIRILINPGDQGDQSRYAVYSSWKSGIEQALRKEKAPAPTVLLSTDATADLGTTRSQIHDIFIAPAHVIGSAVRYGYTPVLGLDRPVQAVLVALSENGAASNLAQTKGKRLGLPMQDSLVTYLMRGEVSAANTSLKGHFSEVYETRYQEALLFCLQVKRCDVVAVERAVFDRWAVAGERVKIVMESRSAPALSVAIKKGASLDVEVLRTALTTSMGGTAGVTFLPLTARDFDYVSTLGYFTPRSLPGATLLDAGGVGELMKEGATFIDTRTEAEFKAGHVPGARLVPYVEKSAKEVDFKAADDQFDLAQLPANRAGALIFACNGAECWKSFKASHAALKAGYSKVYWFRGGFPEWRNSKLNMAAAM